MNLFLFHTCDGDFMVVDTLTMTSEVFGTLSAAQNHLFFKGRAFKEIK